MSAWARAEAARLVAEAIADERRRIAERRAELRGGRRADDVVDPSQLPGRDRDPRAEANEQPSSSAFARPGSSSGAYATGSASAADRHVARDS